MEEIEDRKDLTFAGSRKNGDALIAGGEVDLNRISAIVLDEFRGGRIGKITLESPLKGGL